MTRKQAPGHVRLWTGAERSYLVANWRNSSILELMLALERSEQAVRSRIYRIFGTTILPTERKNDDG